MAKSVEWRIQNGADALLRVDEELRVLSEVSPPDPAILKSYLATAGTGSDWMSWASWQPVEGSTRDPEEWGELVLSRVDSGQISFIDPELFWQGVYRWFRSRGVDFGP